MKRSRLPQTDATRCSEDNEEAKEGLKRFLRESRGERVMMNTAGINVVSPPKDAWKLRKAGVSVSQKGFRPEMRSELDRIEGNYFEELNLLIVTKGYHRAAAAVTLGVDFDVLTTVCKIGELFEAVKTDGAEWEKEGEKKQYPVLDVRVALLF